jgi:hypothetical protein
MHRPFQHVKDLVLGVVHVQRGGESHALQELNHAERVGGAVAVPLDESQNAESPNRLRIVVLHDMKGRCGVRHELLLGIWCRRFAR